MSNETRDGALALQRTINSIYQAAADKRATIADVTFFFDDVPAWQKAVEDFDLAGEASVISNDDVERLFQDTSAELSDLPEEDAYDVNNGLKGIYCIIRLFARKAYLKGLKDGQNGTQ